MEEDEGARLSRRRRETPWIDGIVRRAEEDYFDPYSAYVNWENGFSVKLRHGGNLHILADGTFYNGGEVAYFDYCNAETFSLMDVNNMVVHLGYPEDETSIMYYYLNPRCGTLKDGLRELFEDLKDVVGLLAEVKEFKLIEVFCDHRKPEEISRFCDVAIQEEWEDVIRSRFPPGVTISEIDEEHADVGGQVLRGSTGRLLLENGKTEVTNEGSEEHTEKDKEMDLEMGLGNVEKVCMEGTEKGQEEVVGEDPNLGSFATFQQGDQPHVNEPEVPVITQNSQATLDDGVVTQNYEDGRVEWQEDEVLVEDATDEEEHVEEAPLHVPDSRAAPHEDHELFIDDATFEDLVGNIMAGAPHLNVPTNPTVGAPEESLQTSSTLGGEEDRELEEDREQREQREEERGAEEERKQREQREESFGIHMTGTEIPSDAAGHVFDDNVNVGLHSNHCSDDEGQSDAQVFPEFHPPTGLQTPTFELSMRFRSKAEFREVVKTTKFLTGRPLKVTHNDHRRLRAKCQGPNCTWFLHAKSLRKMGSPDYLLTTMNLNHGMMCEESFEKIKLSAKWVSERMIDKFRGNIKMPLKQIRQEVDAAFKCEITSGKAYLARRYAVDRIQGSAVLQYRKIWDYVNELRRTNQGSTFEVMFEPYRENGKPNKFMRFYSCFGALKQGFLKSCRPIIFLDGCFLTGLYKGQLLTAMGVDGNNGYWPIAWAVVEKEAREQWLWFIKLLVADLEIATESSVYTIMSDQQKGLGSAIAEVLPRAERRFCVQHIYSNFKKSHPGIELKEHLWRIANSTTEEEFITNLEALKVFDLPAYKWVLKAPPRKSWVKAYFPTHVKCDTLVNNMCESFNSKIVKAREKPIISMLEEIRRYVMERIRSRGELTARYGGSFCSVVKNILSKNSDLARGWTAISNGAGDYEVMHSTRGQFIVSVSKKSCTCRLWQLSGIPCIHAIPCIRKNSRNPLDFIDGCYSKSKFMELYSNVLMPINGADLWPKSTMPIMDPPRYVPQIGRPKKSRFDGVEVSTAENGTQRMKRVSLIHCSRCNGVGHNRITCKAVVDENGVCAVHDESIGDLWAGSLFDDVEQEVEHGLHADVDQEPVQQPHEDQEPAMGVAQNAAVSEEGGRKRKRGRPMGSKNKPKIPCPSTTPAAAPTPPAAPTTPAAAPTNASTAGPSTNANEASSSTRRRRARPGQKKKRLTANDKVRINENYEYLGKKAPFRVGRWALPTRRARV